MNFAERIIETEEYGIRGRSSNYKSSKMVNGHQMDEEQKTKCTVDCSCIPYSIYRASIRISRY